MNERFKELSKQAVDYASACEAEAWDGAYERKFAELIVQECLKMCKTAVGNKDYNTGRMHCYDNIKEHFGVEE